MIVVVRLAVYVFVEPRSSSKYEKAI